MLARSLLLFLAHHRVSLFIMCPLGANVICCWSWRELLSWVSLLKEELLDINLTGLDVGSSTLGYILASFSPFVQIVRRGMPPGGGGEVLFSCPVRKVLKPIQLTDPGKIKRIRGMAYPLHLVQIFTFFSPKIRMTHNPLLLPRVIYIWQQSWKNLNSETIIVPEI